MRIVAVPAAVVLLVSGRAPAERPETAPAAGKQVSTALTRQADLSSTPVGTVLMVSANLKEGNGSANSPRDIARAGDRRRFSTRLLRRAPAAPDIVLLQEALGSTAKIVRMLNQHPRIEPTRNRYETAVGPRLAPGGRRCDGHRNHHRDIRRDVSIVINSATIAGPVDSGHVRTWGAYRSPRTPDGATRACKEHVWALLREKDDGPDDRLIRVMNIHPAPGVRALKTAAVRKATERMAQLQRRTPRALTVVGGDFNLTRCRRQPETLDCDIRDAHRYLLDRGYIDAVRTINPRGSNGVSGVKYRIDHIYTTGGVTDSWFDRCYRAFHVTRPACAKREVVFPDKRIFLRCNRLASRGKGPARPCGPKRYSSYYSDHPIVWALLTGPND